VNAGKHKIALAILVFSVLLQTAFADSAVVATRRGNDLYRQGHFDQAIKEYGQALIDRPEVLEPKFNEANSYYRLDDLDQAIKLYQKVAAESKDMKLVTKAKYNMGNCCFQQASKQRDSNLRKAVDGLKTAIGHWRSVLDIEPKNEKAAKNIEVARLTIKDILDQIKKQQQKHDPNQPQDPNQTRQQKSSKSMTPISLRTPTRRGSRRSSNSPANKTPANRKTANSSRCLKVSLTSRRSLINRKSQTNNSRKRKNNRSMPPMQLPMKYLIKNNVTKNAAKSSKELLTEKSNRIGNNTK